MKLDFQNILPAVLILLAWVLWPKVQSIIEAVKARLSQWTGVGTAETTDFDAMERQYGIVGKDGKDPELDAFRSQRIHEAAAKIGQKKKGS